MSLPDPQWLDQMYNNRALVPDFEVHLRRWRDDSERARADASCLLDVPYGMHPDETVDVFPANAPRAPVLVFIHGGYWRSLHSRDHAFIAPAFVQAGACVVLANHSLCPAVRVRDIVLQLVRALVWVRRHIRAYGGDPARIAVVGHSAGGHLAAMLMACRWRSVDPALPVGLVRRGMSISGLHELETIRRTPYLQGSLRLTPQEARSVSPAWLTPAPTPRGAGRLYAVVGELESAEFVRQTRLIQSAWGAACVPVCDVLPGLNHFSILGALTEPDHRVHQLVIELLGFTK